MSNFQRLHKQVQEERGRLQMSRVDFAAFVGEGCTEKHVEWIENRVGLERGMILAVIERMALQLNIQLDILACSETGRSLASVRFNELGMKTIRLMFDYYPHEEADIYIRVFDQLEFGFNEALLGEKSILSAEERQRALEIDQDRLAQLVERANAASEAELTVRNLNRDELVPLQSIIEDASTATPEHKMEDRCGELGSSREDVEAVTKFCERMNCDKARRFLLNRAIAKRRDYEEIVRQSPSAAARGGFSPPDDRTLKKWLQDFLDGPTLFEDERVI